MSGGSEPQGSIGAPTGAKTAAARWQVLRQHVESGVPLTQLAAAEKGGERTLQRWLAAYRKGGIAALAPATPPKRGRRTHPDLVAYIEGLALSTPRPSTAAIFRKAATTATRR